MMTLWREGELVLWHYQIQHKRCVRFGGRQCACVCPCRVLTWLLTVLVQTDSGVVSPVQESQRSIAFGQWLERHPCIGAIIALFMCLFVVGLLWRAYHLIRDLLRQRRLRSSKVQPDMDDDDDEDDNDDNDAGDDTGGANGGDHVNQANATKGAQAGAGAGAGTGAGESTRGTGADLEASERRLEEPTGSRAEFAELSALEADGKAANDDSNNKNDKAHKQKHAKKRRRLPARRRTWRSIAWKWTRTVLLDIAWLFGHRILDRVLWWWLALLFPFVDVVVAPLTFAFVLWPMVIAPADAILEGILGLVGFYAFAALVVLLMWFIDYRRKAAARARQAALTAQAEAAAAGL